MRVCLRIGAWLLVAAVLEKWFQHGKLHLPEGK